MATQQTQVLGRGLLTPAVALLFIWMIVPLAMTIYFSTLHYSLLDSENWSFVGLEVGYSHGQADRGSAAGQGARPTRELSGLSGWATITGKWKL